MKQIIISGLVLIMMLGGLFCNAQETTNNNSKNEAVKSVEVYYFHFTRR